MHASDAMSLSLLIPAFLKLRVNALAFPIFGLPIICRSFSVRIWYSVSSSQLDSDSDSHSFPSHRHGGLRYEPDLSHKGIALNCWNSPKASASARLPTYPQQVFLRQWSFVKHTGDLIQRGYDVS